METLTNVPSEEGNLRTERLISHKCLIHRTEMYLLTNEHPPRISLHPQGNELAAWTLAGRLLFALPVNKYSPP